MKTREDVVADYSHAEREFKRVDCRKCKHTQRVEVLTDVPNYKWRCERCMAVQLLNQ
jgi:ribosomal protein S27E